MIKQAKDTPDGFLSHKLPFRKSNISRFFDSLGKAADYQNNQRLCYIFKNPGQTTLGIIILLPIQSADPFDLP